MATPCRTRQAFPLRQPIAADNQRKIQEADQNPTAESLAVGIVPQDGSLEWGTEGMVGTAVEKCLMNRVAAHDWTVLVDLGVPKVKTFSP